VEINYATSRTDGPEYLRIHKRKEDSGTRCRNHQNGKPQLEVSSSNQGRGTASDYLEA
jgi:hypothetical protein